MTEAVPHGELLHEEALFGYRRQKGGSTTRTLIPVWTLPLRQSRVVWVWPDPLPTRLKRVRKCTDPMVGGARSITLYDACTPSSVGYQSQHWQKSPVNFVSVLVRTKNIINRKIDLHMKKRKKEHIYIKCKVNIKS